MVVTLLYNSATAVAIIIKCNFFAHTSSLLKIVAFELKEPFFWLRNYLNVQIIATNLKGGGGGDRIFKTVSAILIKLQRATSISIISFM